MRGGQPVIFEPRPLRTQFPPHARGSTRRTIGTVLVLVILPACAGVNLAVARCQKVYFYFPRMRGGQPRTPSPFEGDIGFSPHVRGSTHETDTVNSDGMIHPACAGVTLSREWLYEPVYSPRMRGDQPASKKTRSTLSGFSPHARGSTRRSVPRMAQKKILPACAGINPTKK